MATPPPASDGIDGQGFEALAQWVQAIPVETFDAGAAAFDSAVRALNDVTGRLRVKLEELQEVLQGVTGDAADGYGTQLRAEITAVGGSIAGDGGALYRAGDAVAGAQRAMRDLAVERAEALAATTTPAAVSEQFDEQARRVVDELAQTYRQLGAGLPPIPGAADGPAAAEPAATEDGTVDTSSAATGATDVVQTQDAAAGLAAPVTPAGTGAAGTGAAGTGAAGTGAAGTGAAGTGAAGAGGGAAPVNSRQQASQGAGAPPAGNGRSAGGVADQMRAGADPVLGRAAPQARGGPAVADDMLPPAVVRSPQVFGPPAQAPGTGRGRPGAATDLVVPTERPTTSADSPVLGRERETSGDVAGAPLLPATATAAAVGGQAGSASARSAPPDPGTRRTTDLTVPGQSRSGEITNAGRAPATAGERSSVSPGRTTAAYTDPAARLAPDQGRATDRISVRPPGTSVLASPQPLSPAPQLHATAGHGSSAGMPFMPGMGPMGGMGGGLTGRVEDDRMRDVVLQEEPGAWDEQDGAPAVLGRR